MSFMIVLKTVKITGVEVSDPAPVNLNLITMQAWSLLECQIYTVNSVLVCNKSVAELFIYRAWYGHGTN